MEHRGAMLDADRERTALADTAAFEAQRGPPPAARHQRFLAFVENKYGQLLYSEEAITGLVTRTLKCVSRWQWCRPIFSGVRFVPTGGLSAASPSSARR
jgi:hypothetical protein